LVVEAFVHNKQVHRREDFEPTLPPDPFEFQSVDAQLGAERRDPGAQGPKKPGLDFGPVTTLKPESIKRPRKKLVSPGKKKKARKTKRHRNKRCAYTLADAFKWTTRWKDYENEELAKGNKPTMQDFVRELKFDVRRLRKFQEQANVWRSLLPEGDYLQRPTAKQLRSVCKKFAKDKGGEKVVEDSKSGKQESVMDDVHDTLLAFVKKMRGTKPSSGKKLAAQLREGDELAQGTERLYIAYIDLVDRIRIVHPKTFETATHQNWYVRVFRWCRKNGIVRRKASGSAFTHKQALQAASEVRDCLDECRDAVDGDEKLARGQVVNLDETSMRILSLTLMTLDYYGSKNVSKPSHGCPKLCLSIPVIWSADGKVDFVVVYRTNRKGPDIKRWHRIDSDEGAVYWFEAKSKWTSMETYVHILRFFFHLGADLAIFMDDVHKGHGGSPPRFFLDSIGAKRIRIPRNATWLLQAADQSGGNFVLKAIVRDLMRKHDIRRILQEEYRRKPFTCLSEAMKKHVTGILAEARKEMNEKKVAGMINSFDKTVFAWSKRFGGSVPPSSKLQRFLKETEGVQPEKKKKGKARHFCPHDCGESFAKKSSKGWEAHAKVCALQRKELLPPLLIKASELPVEQLNSMWTPTIVVESSKGTFILGRNKGECFDLQSDLELVEEAQWWNTAKNVRYRPGTEEELQRARARGII